MSTVPEKVEPPPGLTYGEPVWEIARLYPAQGTWTECEYLDLNTNQRVEFSDGYLEFLPMPTTSHERIIRFIFRLLDAFVVAGNLGEAFFAGVRVRLPGGKYRAPDIVFMSAEHRARIAEDFWDGADLVMEVVSGSASDRHRDLVEKRAEYARAGIPEYWIVDPAEGRITVLALEASEYVVRGTFVRGERATSRLVPGFEVDVAAALDCAGVSQRSPRCPTERREDCPMSTVPEKVEPPPGLTYGEPVWEIARLYPEQGSWTERGYLDLNTNQRVEFSDGYVEFLPMPTTPHQRIVFFLLRLLDAFARAHDLGEALPAGVRVRLWEGKFREPDVVFMSAEHRNRITDDYWYGADLVMEVVSGSASDRHRDLVEKRAEYARAHIPEYWIVDPAEGRIIVLTLDGTEYAERGTFVRGERATSRLLPGFVVDVTAALDAQ